MYAHVADAIEEHYAYYDERDEDVPDNTIVRDTRGRMARLNAASAEDPNAGAWEVYSADKRHLYTISAAEDPRQIGELLKRWLV